MGILLCILALLPSPLCRIERRLMDLAFFLAIYGTLLIAVLAWLPLMESTVLSRSPFLATGQRITIS